MKLGEVVAHMYTYYNFTKFHQNWIVNFEFVIHLFSNTQLSLIHFQMTWSLVLHEELSQWMKPLWGIWIRIDLKKIFDVEQHI